MPAKRKVSVQLVNIVSAEEIGTKESHFGCLFKVGKDGILTAAIDSEIAKGEISAGRMVKVKDADT